jgi:hypothetical protein
MLLSALQRDTPLYRVLPCLRRPASVPTETCFKSASESLPRRTLRVSVETFCDECEIDYLLLGP